MPTYPNSVQSFHSAPHIRNALYLWLTHKIVILEVIVIIQLDIAVQKTSAGSFPCRCTILLYVHSELLD